MTEQDRVEKVARAIRDQNRKHMLRANPRLAFDREHVTEDEKELARAAIAALTPTPQEAAKVLLRELKIVEPANPQAKMAVFTWLRGRAISEDSQ